MLAMGELRNHWNIGDTLPMRGPAGCDYGHRRFARDHGVPQYFLIFVYLGHQRAEGDGYSFMLIGTFD
jgi:hypothetical protein